MIVAERPDMMPPEGAYVALPEDFGRRFTVSVDTEEDFDWTAPFRREGYGTASIRALPGFQARMDAAGVKPLYIVAYALAVDAMACEVLRGVKAGGNCTIGTHLHPWTTPPFEEELNLHNSFGGNLPEALELAKLTAVTQAIADNLGVQSKVFRAGRYGVGPNTVRLLAGLGYEVEVSSRARFDYTRQGGPSFTCVRPGPFRLAHGMLEIPLSGTYLGPAYAGAEWPRLNAAMVKLRGLRRIGLTPEGTTAEDAVEAIKRLIDEDVRLFSLSFHSPSLEAGHTPFVRTAADLAAFWRWWDVVFDFFAARGITPASTEQIQSACRTGSTSLNAAKPAG